jgi:hypothetical protein
MVVREQAWLHMRHEDRRATCTTRVNTYGGRKTVHGQKALEMRMVRAVGFEK